MKISTITLIVTLFTQIGWGVKPSNNISIKQEIERSLDAGLRWLSQEQNASSGNWGLVEYPALTGLAVRSFLGHPSTEVTKKYEKSIRKGMEFIRSKFSRTEVFTGRDLRLTIPQYACWHLCRQKFK